MCVCVCAPKVVKGAWLSAGSALGLARRAIDPERCLNRPRRLTNGALPSLGDVTFKHFCIYSFIRIRRTNYSSAVSPVATPMRSCSEKHESYDIFVVISQNITVTLYFFYVFDKIFTLQYDSKHLKCTFKGPNLQLLL